MDAQRREAQSVIKTDHVLAKAEAARADREARGVSDSVEAKQQPKAPKFDINLVGKRLEVCWPYKENGETVKIWASGTVRRVPVSLTVLPIRPAHTQRRSSCCQLVRCCGRGTPTQNMMSQLVRSG